MMDGTPSRRQMLKLIGGTSIVLSGCSEGQSTQTETRSATATQTPTPTTRETATETATATETPEETPTETEQSEEPQGTSLWPMFQHNPRNTGTQTDDTESFTSFDQVWSTQIGSAAHLSAGLGRLYSVTNSITALEPESGEELWTSNIGGHRSPPQALGEELYAEAGRRLQQINPSTGGIIWQSERFESPIFGRRLRAIDRMLCWRNRAGEVIAYDVDERAESWRYSTMRKSVAPVYLTTDTVYVGGQGVDGEHGGILHAIDRSEGTARWRFETKSGPGIPSAPIRSEGTVYVANDGGFIHAVDAQSGKERWRTNHGNPVVAQPTVIGDRIFVPSRGFPDGFIKAFDTTSGERIWQTKFDGTSWDSAEVFASPVYYDKTLVVGADNGVVYGLNPENGEIRWQYNSGNKVRSLLTHDAGLSFSNYSGITSTLTGAGDEKWSHQAPPAPTRGGPSVGDDSVYVHGADARLHAYNRTDGTEQWSQQTEQPIDSVPVFHDGTVYAQATKTGAFDAATGDVQWGFRPVAQSTTSPTVVDDTLYVAESATITETTAYAVDTTTGDITWKQSTQRPLTASPAVDGGRMYSASDGGVVYALSTDDGSVLWRHRIGTPCYAGISVADGIVYVGGRNGYLYAIKGSDGSRQWRHNVNMPVNASPIISGETAIVPTIRRLVAVDLESRQIAWQAQHRTLLQVAPAAAGETVYHAAADGALRAFDIESGEQLAKFDTGKPAIRSPPAVTAEYLYICGGNGRLYRLGLES